MINFTVPTMKRERKKRWPYELRSLQRIMYMGNASMGNENVVMMCYRVCRSIESSNRLRDMKHVSEIPICVVAGNPNQ